MEEVPKKSKGGFGLPRGPDGRSGHYPFFIGPAFHSKITSDEINLDRFYLGFIKVY